MEANTPAGVSARERRKSVEDLRQWQSGTCAARVLLRFLARWYVEVGHWLMMGRRGFSFLCVLTLPIKYPISKSPQILGRCVAPLTAFIPSMMLFASLFMSSMGFLVRRWNFCGSWRMRSSLPRYLSSLISTKAVVLSARRTTIPSRWRRLLAAPCNWGGSRYCSGNWSCHEELRQAREAAGCSSSVVVTVPPWGIYTCSLTHCNHSCTLVNG